MDKSELVLLIQTEAQNAISSLKGVNAELGKSQKASLNLSTSFGKLAKSAFSIYTIKKSVDYFYKATQASIDYTETLNLFSVALTRRDKNNIKYLEKGLKFQDDMNEAFGTNKEEMMRSQGLYTAIGTSLGLASDQAYTLGENLTKISLDLSSLYNKDIETVNQALKSGLVGQTKAVRQLGMDITEKTLNAQLLTMGITDRTTATMSQTEKVILRYIVMLKQATIAQGDFANTIESPANQLRILKNQVAEITRWIGNIFYGVLKDILPYINAFAMVIKEAVKTIAIFFGYKEDASASGAFAEGLDLEGLEEGLGDANKSAKKLKNTLQSFDEIHNIQTDNGDTTGLGGGIDQRLIDAMKGYESAMEKIRMKALDIRDTILEFFSTPIGKVVGTVGGVLFAGLAISGLTNIFKTAGKVIGVKGVGAGATASAGSGLMGILWTLSLIAIACVPLYIIQLAVNGLEDVYEAQQAQIDLNQQYLDGNVDYIKGTIDKLKYGKLTEEQAKRFSDWAVSAKDALLEQNKTLEKQAGEPWNKITGQSVVFNQQIQDNNKQLALLDGVMNTVKGSTTGVAVEAGKISQNISDADKKLQAINGYKVRIDAEINTAKVKTGFASIIDSMSSLFKKSAIGIALSKLGGNFSFFTGSTGGSGGGSFRANGGFVSTGEMFVAREAGPELVGKIGNHTAVANNSQIVSAVSQGVAQAVSGVVGSGGNQNFQLFIGDKEITDLVVKKINSKTQQFGVSPLKG